MNPRHPTLPVRRERQQRRRLQRLDPQPLVLRRRARRLDRGRQVRREVAETQLSRPLVSRWIQVLIQMTVGGMFAILGVVRLPLHGTGRVLVCVVTNQHSSRDWSVLQ